MIALLQPLAAHAEHHPSAWARGFAALLILGLVALLLGFALFEMRRAPMADDDGSEP